MRRLAALLIAPAALFLLASMSAPLPEPRIAPAPVAAFEAAPPPAPAPAPEPPPPVRLGEVLADGIVIVVSKPDQRMYVFEDGALWRSSPVSTGKKGHGTPSGVFAILQKKKFHRSNLYSNAPMPFMQRLTWSGIAIHAGHLPGYPASHGCIRLPHAFARELYAKTGFTSTGVIVTDEKLATERDALRLASATDAALPIDPDLLLSKEERMALVSRTAREALVQRSGEGNPVTADKVPAGGQTIQLAAALSPDEAAAHWERLSRIRPELSQMQMRIVPAVVNARQYYRLRVSAPGAHRLCGDLKRSGIDCFAVS